VRKIIMTTQDGKRVHAIKEQFDGGLTVCGRWVTRWRIYPLLWTDRERMITCGTCRSARRQRKEK
jgi:hypothetical protein